MTDTEREKIIGKFHRFIGDKGFPCVAARTAMAREHIAFLVLDHFACPQDDREILRFLYEFIIRFREANGSLFTAVIIFKEPAEITEAVFDDLLWAKLQALSILDAENFNYDKRVSAKPTDPHFSFSLGEEGLFIVGLHPGSSRPSRKFEYPGIVFNPHAQFEALRESGHYEKLKKIIRQRDIRYSGSVNPMLADFGDSAEARQYSGRRYGPDWTCPLKVVHGETQHHSSPQQRFVHHEKGPAPDGR